MIKSPKHYLNETFKPKLELGRIYEEKSLSKNINY